MKNKLVILLMSALVLTVASCSREAGRDANSQTQTAAAEQLEVGNAQTPTDAYTMLFKAVKAKQTDAIKKMMSQKTISFAEGVAGQQKKPVAAVYENGFTATTFAATLPQMRDERVKDNMGALEVWNEKEKKWEDLPFIKEEDGWKLAIGDIFAGTYEKPAKGQAQIEAEASNKSQLVPYGNGNFNGIPPAMRKRQDLFPQKPLESNVNR